MTIRYMDYENGLDANSGASFVLAKKTLDGVSAICTAGDIVHIAKSPDPVSQAINATWTNNTRSVVLASALTKNVDDCELAWTASANVTATADATLFLEGTKSAKFVIAAGFTTGLIAYKAVTTADYSGYTKLTFWVHATAAVAVSTLSVRLCSDAVGAVSVNTFPIPAIVATNRWIPIAVSLGSALSASISSVAIYADLDPGSVTVYLDNIQACNSFSLQSLIGKNNVDDASWYPINYISSDGLTLGFSYYATAPTGGYTYAKSTETISFYTRETIKTLPINATVTSILQSIACSGVSGSVTQFLGGYNTATDSQDGNTFFDSLACSGYAISITSRSYLRLQKISVVRCYRALQVGSGACVNISIEDAHFNGHADAGMSMSGSATHLGISLLNVEAHYNNTHGISILGQRLRAKNCIAHSNKSYGFNISTASDTLITSCSAKNNQIGFIPITPISYLDCITSGNSLAGFYCGAPGSYVATNCTISEATEVYFGDTGRFLSKNHDTTAGNHQIMLPYGRISLQTSIVHTAAQAWKFAPTSTTICVDVNPLELPIYKVVCLANVLKTVSAWVRRDSVSLSLQLCIRAGQALGITTDIVVPMTAAIDTWEQISIPFTPTENCVVELLAQAYGGTTLNGYIADVTVV
jgi:hypothetical protein